jgi:uncharacterized membrane protein (DUF485 family)
MAYLKWPIWVRWVLLVPALILIFIASSILAAIYQHFAFGEYSHPDSKILFFIPANPFFVYTKEMITTWLPAYCSVRYAAETIPENKVMATGLTACLIILVHLLLIILNVIFRPHESGTIWNSILFAIAALIAAYVFVVVYKEESDKTFQRGRQSALSDYPRGESPDVGHD